MHRWLTHRWLIVAVSPLVAEWAAAAEAVVDPHATAAGLPVVDWVASPPAAELDVAAVAVEDPHGPEAESPVADWAAAPQVAVVDPHATAVDSRAAVAVG
jgi:hypothetical protein